jgi:hypothetical protein
MLDSISLKPMKPEIIIAIASAIAAITGAIIALIQSVRTARLKAATDLALEKIKADKEKHSKSHAKNPRLLRQLLLKLGKTFR